MKTTLRLIGAGFLAWISMVHPVQAEYPDWWVDRGAIHTNASLTNDFLAVNQGQVKWMVMQAAAELDEYLPHGGGTNLSSRTNTFTSTNNYRPVNQGQLKNIAKLVYDRLIAEGYTNSVPWSEATNDDSNFSMANIGQVKNLFNFDLRTDSDADGLRDWRERHWFGDLTQTATNDADGDGLENGEEFDLGTSPTNNNTDGDRALDGAEVGVGTDPRDSASFPIGISGIVTYGGRQTGLVQVVVVTEADSWSTNISDCLSGPEQFAMTNFPNLTNYWVRGWRDSNGNGLVDWWEAQGTGVGSPCYPANDLAGLGVVLADPDTDADMLPDWWELHYFGAITNQAGLDDYDTDGLINNEEYRWSASPMTNDTDGDMVSDWEEVNLGRVITWGDDYFYPVPDGLDSVKRVACGYEHTVMLKNDGRLTYVGGCYGDDWNPLENYATNYLSISAGEYYNLGLTKERMILWWADWDYSMMEITNAMAVSAGNQHNLALLTDGIVVCWGDNTVNQTNVPEALSNVTAIAAGGSHSMALRHDGTVVCWGSTNASQCAVPEGLSEVVAIAAGSAYSLALKADGTVIAWGTGQSSVPEGLEGVFAIGSGPGAGHSAALIASDPTMIDTDGDGLSDYDERQTYHTNYRSTDTDQDGLPDLWECTNGLNAIRSIESDGAGGDPDGDGLSNLLEYQLGSSPQDSDTDNDGLPDSWEYENGLDFLDAAGHEGATGDPDGDGLSNLQEYQQPTDPFDVDTDADGLVDGWSGVVTTNLYAGGVDTNADGYAEGELTAGTEPTEFDTDGDGLSDGEELARGLNPLNVDTDDDELWDNEEDAYGLNPRLWDTDGDGVSDMDELVSGSDPTDGDSYFVAIAGTAVYQGKQEGVIRVYADVTNGGNSAQDTWVADANGHFEGSLLSGTSYWIWAYCDADCDGIYDEGEAYGSYTSNPLANVSSAVTSVTLELADENSDADGLPDWWEWLMVNASTNDGITNLTGVLFTADFDNDGYSNGNEYQYGADPCNPSSHMCSISGNVLNAGYQTGAVIITIESMDSDGLVGCVTNADVGVFVVSNLANYTWYWVAAWMDSNANGLQEEWEAWGACSNNPIWLTNSMPNIEITLVDPDTDGDGLSDAWEHLIVDANTNDSLTNIVQILPEDDFDNDGASNGFEFSIQSDPANGGSYGPLVGIYPAAVTTVEDQVSVTLTVAVSAIQSGTIMVGVDVVGGTATRGEDYFFAATSLVFNAGQTSQTVVINVQTDSIPEGVETAVFGIRIQAGMAAIATGHSRAVLTVTEGFVDSDSDGLPDSWEMARFGNLDQTAEGDGDGDGLPNLVEWLLGIDPTVAALPDTNNLNDLRIAFPRL